MNTENIIITSSMRNATKSILKTVEDDGFMAIHGPIGIGKTTLMRRTIGHFEEQQNKYAVIHLHEMGYKSITINGIMDFMIKSLTHFQEHAHRGQIAMQLQLKKILIDVSRSKKIILAIDDAQDLNPERVLRGLKKMRELSFGSRMHLFSTILFGQKKLGNIIAERREINYRVKAIEMKEFNQKEKEEYVSILGIKLNSKVRPLFIKYSPGTPAGIASYLEELLNEAYLLGKTEITKEVFTARLYRWIERLRLELGYSKARMAKILGCDRATLNKIEKGESALETAEKLKNIAAEFAKNTGINLEKISNL